MSASKNPITSKHVRDLFNVAKDWKYFVALFRDSEYRIPFFRKILYTFLIIYIIIPFDFIPGIFPVIGMVDDLGAFGVGVGALLYEIVAYLDFLDEKRRLRKASEDGPVSGEGTDRGVSPTALPSVNERKNDDIK